ncbi:hypothetical protein [Chryseobacterium bernardetii]|uniref:hypothetical protein n=1 Tax=Chryseobacterium bernardetii TaxID=1241978 RepID=UPI0016232249|nr:hypothetical protein [Chryseobacterium bernardetii]
MKTFKESLLNLLGLKTKEEFAEELNNVLDSYSSSIAVRLESEFIFRDFETSETIGSNCYITPPCKGEFYITDNAIYEVMQVTHSYKQTQEAGTIQVKKVRELKSK